MATAIDAPLNERLKRLRKHAQKTETQMAAACGVTQPGYQNYEGGKAKPPIERMAGIASEFGMRTPVLLFALGMPGFDEYAAELEQWWEAVIERQHAFKNAWLQNPLYAPGRNDSYEDETDLKMNSDRPQPPLTLCSPFATPMLMAL